MKMEKENKRGISLIVLVITIIVMIILAGVIILSLSSNGIIGKANQAKVDTDTANLKEAAALALAEYDLEVSTGGINKEETTATEYVKEKLGAQGFSEYHTNLIYLSESGKLYVYDEPKIPAGFVKSSISTEDEVGEGLVIYEIPESERADVDWTETITIDDNEILKVQSQYNQYVWVPVPDMSEFVLRDGYYNGEPQTKVSSGSATEPWSKGTLSATNDLTEEYAEYAKMKASIEKYGGFYIARYEAGTTNPRTATTTVTSFKTDGTTPDVLSQKNKLAYNYVGWGPSMTVTSGVVKFSNRERGKGAVELSRSIYPENANKEIVSTLIYGVQWDSTLNFMKDIKNPNGTTSEYYIYDSTGMGWDSNNKSNNAEHKTGIDIGNSLNMVKNIYDMAGNVGEWTMEAYLTNCRIWRGTAYSWNSSQPSYRTDNSPYCAYEHMGFRVALYLR